eukprot:4804568-Prymnesium_polylepis.3
MPEVKWVRELAHVDDPRVREGRAEQRSVQPAGNVVARKRSGHDGEHGGPDSDERPGPRERVVARRVDHADDEQYECEALDHQRSEQPKLEPRGCGVLQGDEQPAGHELPPARR